MMYGKKVSSVIGAVALVYLAASSAQAVPITTTGVWTNPQPPSGPVFDTVVGVGTDEISWGTPIGGGSQSSYEFNGLTSVDIGNPLDGHLFPLGDFVHNNFPINDFQFLGADLSVVISVPSIPVAAGFGPFSFLHNETPNSPPCDPAGDPPCPDVVSIPLTLAGTPFTFGGQNFVFFLAGFQPPGGGPIIPDFITTEGQSNTATLFAGVRPVPEPTTLFLLGLGLLGLGVISRRRKKA